MKKTHSNSDYILALIILIFAPIVYGYVLSVLWSWFVVSTFHLPTLSIPIAIGISMTVRMITSEYKSQSDDKRSPVEAALQSILTPLVTLGAAWIVTIFV